MKTQAEHAATFAALHRAPGGFILPNPWDVGSAQILAGLGFKALATTSAGFARSLGRVDYQAGRESVLSHVRALASAVDLPLAGDLEDGFGRDPKICAETIRLSADAGLVGGSIEDATGDPAQPIYALEEAAERVRAAAEAAAGLSFPYMLCARAENYLHGRPDLADVIKRLQAYQEAGADVLFAPGLNTVEEVRTLCAEVDRPVNVMRGPRERVLGIDELIALGVKRVSLGGLLHAAAASGLIQAARELQATGSFSFLADLVSGGDIDALLKRGARPHASPATSR